MNLAASNLLTRRLPDCPPPSCRACRQPLFDVRPFRADQPHARLVLVHCLSRCGRCSTPHIGVRALAPLAKGLKFIHQSFDRYTAERQAELTQVAEFLTRGEHAVELHPDRPYPPHPRFAVWFENTLVDPERAAPAAPAAGLPAAALGANAEGIEILETRGALAAEHLSGILVSFTSLELAHDWLESLRLRARSLGTIAWCRRYDIAEHAIAWDTGTPAPGNPYVRTTTVTSQEGNHGTVE